MDISINKMKVVIDELQVAEMGFSRQLNAFEKISFEYQSIEKEGNDKRILRRISDDLNNEYHSIKKLRKVLTEVVREYENAEQNIINDSSNTFRNHPIFKRIDIEATQKILNQFHIKIM